MLYDIVILLYPYHKLLDIYNLLLTDKALSQYYRQEYIWKYFTERQFTNLTKVNPHITNYYIWYSILLNTKHRCHICYQTLNNQENEGENILLLCDCLGLKNYLYAHKSCQYYTVKKGFHLYQYKCRYCQKTKLCLPIKTLI